MRDAAIERLSFTPSVSSRQNNARGRNAIVLRDSLNMRIDSADQVGMILRLAAVNLKRNSEWPVVAVTGRSPLTASDPKPSVDFLGSKHSRPYSITLSARSNIESGKLRPSALAVFMLSTNSNLVG